MAFSLQRLQRLGGGLSEGSIGAWTYSSDDTFLDVTGQDYFIDAIHILKVGDSISSFETGASLTIAYVSTNDGTTISVSAAI